MERNLTLSDIVRDPSLQARESLDESWVAELADLYRGNHEIAPIEAVYDGARYLLTNGWHRLKAQEIAWGADALIAVSVIDASGVDDPMSIAKTRAAMANREGGLRRTEGDKRRAIHLLRSTSAGRKMTHDEVAKRVGVSRSWVTRVLDGGDVRTNIASTATTAYYGGAPRPSIAALWEQVDAALQADPGKADAHHAQDLDCHATVVRKRRAALGLPKSDPTRHRENPARQAVIEDLKSDASQGVRELSKKHGVARETVSKAREELGLPPPQHGGYRPRKTESGATAEPSAPVNPRRTDDPREQGVEIMAARPLVPPARVHADKAIEMIQAFERASPLDRQTLVTAIHRRWPEYIRNAIEEAREQETEQRAEVLN